jgi:hypothetical protein
MSWDTQAFVRTNPLLSVPTTVQVEAYAQYASDANLYIYASSGPNRKMIKVKNK